MTQENYFFRIRVNMIINYHPRQTRSHQSIIEVSAKNVMNERDALEWVKRNTDAYFIERYEPENN